MVSNVLVPAEHYVGMVKREGDELPLGFMTPWGEDAASKKRIATVDSWASRGYNSSEVEAQVIKNIPLSGFKFTSSIRNSGYGGHDKWRIEDPRGFELEITSGNLAQLMSVGIIDRGEINDQCVWGRQGANNILLSTSTDEYKEAVKNTTVFNTSASWTNVKLGDTVTLQNTITGIWLGRQYPIYLGDSHMEKTDAIGHNKIEHDTKMVHVIYVVGGAKTSYQNKVDALHLIASPKLSSITPCDTPLTKAQAEVLANQYLTSNSVDLNTAGYKTILILSFGKAKFTLDKVPLTVTNTLELDSLCHYDQDNVFITLKNGKFGHVTKSYRYNNNIYVINLYGSVDENELRPIMVGHRNRDYWNRGYELAVEEYNFTATDNFCNLQLTATTAEGNIIKRMIV